MIYIIIADLLFCIIQFMELEAFSSVSRETKETGPNLGRIRSLLEPGGGENYALFRFFI